MRSFFRILTLSLFFDVILCNTSFHVWFGSTILEREREREREGFRVLQLISYVQISKRRRNGDALPSFHYGYVWFEF
jgi:hypothetical protein